MKYLVNKLGYHFSTNVSIDANKFDGVSVFDNEPDARALVGRMQGIWDDEVYFPDVTFTTFECDNGLMFPYSELEEGEGDDLYSFVNLFEM